MKVCIVGASGKLGRYMVQHALDRGYDVVGVCRERTVFAVGSALFSYLLLRGRMIPTALAWLGVVASVLLVVCLPLQLAGFLHGMLASLIWLPMLAFEVPLALWLIVKGVRVPARAQPA